MYSFNIPVPPDEDFPEVVVAQRMGEGFEEEYVEYEPRWRFDKRRRAVVVDEKFFYAMADTAERLSVENAKLRELVSWMYDRMDESCAVQYPYAPTPISYDRLMQAQARARELGIEVE